MKEYAMIKRIEERAEKKKDNLLEKAYRSTEEIVARYKKDDPKNQASKRQRLALKEQ
jgi:hypothetical protein